MLDITVFNLDNFFILISMIGYIAIFILILIVFDFVIEPPENKAKKMQDEGFSRGDLKITTFDDNDNDDIDTDNELFYLYDPDTDDISGLHKCRKLCNGVCVQRGYTMDAMCIPYYEGQIEQLNEWKTKRELDISTAYCNSK